MNQENDAELTILEQQRGQAIAATAVLQDSTLLNMLTDDEQIAIIDNVTGQTVHTKVYEYVEEKVRTETFTEYIENVNIDVPKLAELVTFDNTHLLAYTLAHSETPEIAVALLEELSYWKEIGRIT